MLLFLSREVPVLLLKPFYLLGVNQAVFHVGQQPKTEGKRQIKIFQLLRSESEPDYEPTWREYMPFCSLPAK